MHTKHTLRTLAVVAAAGLALTACGTTSSSSTASGSGSSCPSGLKIAFLGAQTGDYANLGINISNGANVALDDYNKANPDCKVTMQKFDSQGDPNQATKLATQIIQDKSIIGVVGPAFSGESGATGDAFNGAGLVTVSASATDPALTTHGWTTFHRVVATDADQAPQDAKYIKDTLGAKKVFVIDDSSEYGKGLADGVKKGLGNLVTSTDEVQQKQTDFSATVTKVTSSGADAVFYGGYYAEAGLLVKQLRANGYKGAFMSGDGSLDPGFIQAAGAAAANGSILTCPCAPSSADFTSKYKADNNGAEPGTYSAEGYDAANVLLSGIAEGKYTRADLLDWVNSYDADGLTKHIKFNNGEVSTVVIYAYKVGGGKIQPGQPIK
ncbi:MAG TPA: branched-chain amino acid ABC transporter substrate-binding protein [Nocardioides sp.]|uniref:branched-chain amino acid ABC transporter substrate-binding protein n=1 Tax=Nocardioides sp. TaxID=35761 RepID=UPI002F3EA6DD